MASTLVLSSQNFFDELVEQGFTKRKMTTHPSVKAYLVKILEYYLDARNLFDEEVNESGQRRPNTLAELLLVANQSSPLEKVTLLKKLGDKSLYISGFFGDSLDRKVIDIDYYADMGGTAYGALADTLAEESSVAIYRTFSTRFLDFVEVLTCISQDLMVQTDENVLRLYDRYLRTGSPLAQERLAEMGIVTVPSDQLKLGRQD